MAEPRASMQEIETRLKAIIDYVQDCERRVMKGEVMDLRGLDDNVVEICDAVAALPPKDGRALEKLMGRLIDKLEDLANAMKTQQDKVSAMGAN